MKKVILIVLFVICKIAFTQSHNTKNDTLNFTDQEGKRQGKWIITNNLLNKPEYKPNQKVEEGRYVESKKVGKWLEYFPNNNIKSKITYESNKPNGYAVLYHDNGKVKEEGLWKNNRWVGEYKLYYENGEVQQYFNFNASGKREGKQAYYYDNGQVMIEGNWEGGKESGLLKEYYENGDLKAEKNFNGGTMDVATVKNYAPKKPIEAVKTGKPPAVKDTPPVVVQKTEKDNFGKPFNGEGYWKLYNNDKQISKDGVFSKNRLIEGKVYNYNRDGILTRIAVYKEGRYVGDAVIEEQ